MLYAARCTLQTAAENDLVLCSRLHPPSGIPRCWLPLSSIGCTEHGVRSSCFEDTDGTAPRIIWTSWHMCRSARVEPQVPKSGIQHPPSLHPAFPPATCDLLQPPKAETYQTATLTRHFLHAPAPHLHLRLHLRLHLHLHHHVMDHEDVLGLCGGLRRGYLSVSGSHGSSEDVHEQAQAVRTPLVMAVHSLSSRVFPPLHLASSPASPLPSRYGHADKQMCPLTTWARWPIAA